MSALEKKMTDQERGLDTKDSHAGYVDEGAVAHDEVFGDLTERGPNYRNVGWIGSAILMAKTQIGLGVLSIPAAFDALGMIPGLICLCTIALITTWTGHVIGDFKMKHRDIYSIDEANQLIFGRIGREVFAAGFILFWCFGAGSGMLSISIGFNAISSHGACTSLFIAVAAALGFGIASIRTLGRLAWFAWIGLICIMSAILVLTIGVGIQDRPDAAPQEGTWVSDYKIVNSPSFYQAVNAVSQFLMAFAGVPAYFPIAAEMRDPHRYTRSLLLCQGFVTAVYVTIGCVVYFYCGSYVSTPALGSAGKTLKKVSYGLAIPGLLATTVLSIHYASKNIFIRLLRGSEHLTANTIKHWVTWFACTFSVAAVAYIIASSVPSFGSLASLIGAVFGTLLSVTPMGYMWLYDHWSPGKLNPTLRWRVTVCWSVFVILAGLFILVAGTYAAALDMKKAYEQPGQPGPFTCLDNSHS